MEKGVKVVAVNDPFIDPQYMVRSRQRVGPKSVGLRWGGAQRALWKAPAAMQNPHQDGNL